MIPKAVCLACAPCGYGPVHQVPTGYIGLLTEFEKVIEKLEPGLHTVNTCSQKVVLVCLMTQLMDIPAQSLLTRDNVTIMIDAYVSFKIRCPELAIFKIGSYLKLIRLQTQGAMRAVVAERNLEDLLRNRKEVEAALTEIIDNKTDPFGIDVIGIETKGMDLPKNMRRAMATVAESKKEAEAKVVDAEGNLKSSKIFRKAADELKGNPIAVQLKYFELIKMIAETNESTLVVPDSVIRNHGGM